MSIRILLNPKDPSVYDLLYMLDFELDGDSPHATRSLQGFPRAVLGCESRGAAVSGRALKGARRHGKSAALLLGFTQENLLIVLVQMACPVFV